MNLRGKISLRAAARFLPAMVVLVFGCGDPPTSPPANQTGSLEIRGLLPDGSLPDSLEVVLDDVSWGRFSNPYLCANIAAGTHLVTVSSPVIVDSVMIAYSGAQQVTILPDTILQKDFTLLGLAPDFSLYSYDSSLVCLDSLAGKVVLLYFFSAT